MSNGIRTTKGLIKTLFGHFIFRSHLHVFSLREFVPVLAFHRISKASPRDGLTFGLNEFTSFCTFLSRNFRVISLTAILEKLKNGGSFRDELAITFDDGYEDNHDLAAPVLKALNLPATFFVATQYIGNDIDSWWDKKQGVRRKWMTWDQVRALHQMGFEIGSHTRTHADLGKVPDEQALNELVGSRIELEEHLSAPITLFAYPYGGPRNITDNNRDLVRVAGYSCCCSCFGGLNDGGTDPFRLRRIPISNWYQSPHDFGFQLSMHRV